MHNMTGFLGAAVGVAIAVVIWVVIVSLRKERSGDAPQFDERQLAARARAYSSAFFTLLGYLASWRCSIRSLRCTGVICTRRVFSA